MINQLTVFIENRPGRLQSLCETLGDADVNMRALMVADTTEFGVVRIVCDAPERARVAEGGEGEWAEIAICLHLGRDRRHSAETTAQNVLPRLHHCHAR